MIPASCTRWLLVACIVLAAILGAAGPVQGQEVKLTVVAILATDRNTKVAPELKCLAEEIRKKNPTLTGFRMGEIARETVKVGQKKSFPLVDAEEATILVRHGANADNWVGLSVWPPQMGKLCYTTRCSKFFPILTEYTTKKHEVLILAISVGPCKDQK